MSHATTYNILLSLQEIFGDKDKLTRQVVLRTMMNTMMTKGTPVRDHIVHMIKLFNEIKMPGSKIDKKN